MVDKAVELQGANIPEVSDSRRGGGRTFDVYGLVNTKFATAVGAEESDEFAKIHFLWACCKVKIAIFLTRLNLKEDQG